MQSETIVCKNSTATVTCFSMFMWENFRSSTVQNAYKAPYDPNLWVFILFTVVMIVVSTYKNMDMTNVHQGNAARPISLPGNLLRYYVIIELLIMFRCLISPEKELMSSPYCFSICQNSNNGTNPASCRRMLVPLEESTRVWGSWINDKVNGFHGIFECCTSWHSNAARETYF